MQLNTSFTALADPTRLAIVARLADEGEVDATELARPFDISQPAVSRHIRVLEEAGWITRRQVGVRRPIRLNAAKVEELHIWSSRLLQAMAGNFDRLDRLLTEKDRNP